MRVGRTWRSGASGTAMLAALLLANGCAGGANEGGAGTRADWSKVETIPVQLADYRFAPGEIALEQGKPYRLRLENTGKDMHEFTAPTFLAAARLRNAAEALSPDRRQIVVDAGQTREVDLVAPPPGTYELFCADHDWAGMVGRIVVR